VLETVPKRKDRIAKDLAVSSQTLAQSGTPDCLMVHRTMSDAPGWSAVKLAALENRRRRTAKNHRLSGEPTVTSANGRPRNLHATCGLLQRSAGAPDCPVRQSAQRSNGRICQIWKEIAHRTVYRTFPVVHQTVRCATRQKARIAFHVDLQWLLAALGV
jgi:hypothetical protein